MLAYHSELKEWERKVEERKHLFTITDKSNIPSKTTIVSFAYNIILSAFILRPLYNWLIIPRCQGNKGVIKIIQSLPCLLHGYVASKYGLVRGPNKTHIAQKSSCFMLSVSIPVRHLRGLRARQNSNHFLEYRQRSRLIVTRQNGL